jgi:nitrate reductase beta subunit
MNEMPDIASGSGFAGTSGVSDPLAERSADDGDRSHLRGRLNLLNWNGKGRPTGLFPSADGPAGA